MRQGFNKSILWKLILIMVSIIGSVQYVSADKYFIMLINDISEAGVLTSSSSLTQTIVKYDETTGKYSKGSTDISTSIATGTNKCTKYANSDIANIGTLSNHSCGSGSAYASGIKLENAGTFTISLGSLSASEITFIAVSGGSGRTVTIGTETKSLPDDKSFATNTWNGTFTGDVTIVTTGKDIRGFFIITTGAACADATPTISKVSEKCGQVSLQASGATAGATYTWYKDGANTGSTGTTYDATASGTYKVVANLTCDKTSNELDVTVGSTVPAVPTISQNGNKITISGEGGTLEYSLDGTNWTTYTAPFDITQDETIRARETNGCGTSEVATKSATYSEGPTCGYVGDDAGTLSATTGYDMGDFVLYHGGNAGSNYNTSTSNLCGDAAKRYYMDYVIVYLENTGASQINIVGHQSSAVTASSVEISDALDGTYTSLTHGTISSDINNGCGTIVIPEITAKQGKYVKITFDGEVRVSGICVTPIPCPTPKMSGNTQIYSCGTKNTTTMTVTEVTAGDGSTVGTWSSSDATIATVDASTGKVTAVALGVVNIMFTPTDAENFCAARKSITVSDVTLTGPTAVTKDETITLSSNLTGGVFSSSNTAVATVDASTGAVTGKGKGTTTITYTVSGCTKTLDITGYAPTALVAVDAPVLSNATTDGFTVSWNASTEEGVTGYVLHIYDATTGMEVKSIDIAGKESITADITGLDQNTQYNAKIVVVGNGSTTKDSPLSAVSNTIETLKERIASSCLTEGFEDLVPSGVDNSNNCPSDATTPTILLRYMSGSSTSKCDAALLGLSSGNWPATLIGAQGGSYTHSGTRALYMYRGGTLQSPDIEMPMQVEFYVYAKGAQSASSTGRGFKVYVDGSALTSGVLVDDVEIAVSTTAVPSFSSENNGTIRLGDPGWHKVTIPMQTTNKNFKIESVAGNSASDIYIDDITVKCDPQELTISPDLTGLTYIKDLGPSESMDITLTGTSLPVENGTATLDGAADFEVSLDGGLTWTSGSAISIPYTNGSFAKSAKVRIPKDKPVQKYSNVFTLSAPGYTKTAPSITVKGEVTLFPIIVSCGQSVEVLNLKSPGLDVSNPSYMDLAAGENWTTSGTVSSGKNSLGAYAFELTNGGIISPSINANDYDFLRLRFDIQPASGSSSNQFLIQVYGSNGYICNKNEIYSQKQIYSVTVDLTDGATMGSYNVILKSPTEKTFYISNIVLEGTAKRKMSFEPGAIDNFQSYPDCPSEPREITIFGTCLDDDSSIDFTSYKNNGAEKYEFSTDGVTGWSSALSVPYTGEYPMKGVKVYVRQKEGLPAGNVSDVILVRNGGKGSAFLTLSGQATAAGEWQPADGAVYNFSSASGVAEEFAIPFSGGPFCADPTISTSCTGVTVSNCKDGVYATSSTIPASVTDGKIYVRYTPGTLTDCDIAITAAGETHHVKVNWNGGTAVTTGVQLSSSTVTVPGSVSMQAKGADMDAAVTITSDKFEVSTGNPAFGDFTAIDTTTLKEMTGTLYVRYKSGQSGAGTIVIATAGGDTVTLNCN